MIAPPIIFLIVSIVLWQLAGAVFMPELLANRIFEILPVATIETGVRWLGPLAKQLALCQRRGRLLWDLLWIRTRLGTGWKRTFGNVWLGALVLWSANVLILFPLAGKGLFGIGLPQGGLSASVLLFASHWIYARMLQLQAPRRQPLSPAARRGFIVAAGLAIVATGKRAYDIWFRPAGRIDRGTGQFPSITGLSKEITPADEFYTVSKNSVDPVVTAPDWKLTVDGSVDNPSSLSMDGPPQNGRKLSMYATLACISNEVGGTLDRQCALDGRASNECPQCGRHGEVDA